MNTAVADLAIGTEGRNATPAPHLAVHVCRHPRA